VTAENSIAATFQSVLSVADSLTETVNGLKDSAGDTDGYQSNITHKDVPYVRSQLTYLIYTTNHRNMPKLFKIIVGEFTVEPLYLLGAGKAKRHCVDCGKPLPVHKSSHRRGVRCQKCNARYAGTFPKKRKHGNR